MTPSRKTKRLAEADAELLRRLSGAGMFLLPAELAADLEMDAAEVRRRLRGLVDRGLVKCYVTATTEGTAALLADLSVQKAKM